MMGRMLAGGIRSAASASESFHQGMKAYEGGRLSSSQNQTTTGEVQRLFERRPGDFAVNFGLDERLRSARVYDENLMT